MGLLKALESLADGSERSERRAAQWHRMFFIPYAALIVLYTGAIVFHKIAATRHDRDAAKKSARGADL